ncbi:hypothetical protein FCU45_04720 [Sulfurimonas crateris]|uniref:Uncharacterized protein n=1 Tax=Sulfurimonas crateris TaxID=2574727 RepID=A0A4U2Z6R5_9BACT|nr:hypothetical protein [Sulfurimonas crateris]TKI69918.1 hypothetical protein FCU45_04720 [Sulfurimonas crateris]
MVKNILNSNYYFIISITGAFCILYLGLNGYVRTTTNDDIALLNLLRANEPHTLILHYLSSLLLGELYTFLPHLQWYSIFILFLNLFLIIVFHYFMKRYQEKIWLYGLFVVFIAINFIYFSITALTVVYIIASLFILKRSFFLFIIFLSIASLLRTGIVTSIIPFIFLNFLLFRPTFNKKYFLLLIPMGIILIHIFLKMQQPYQEWYEYNTARGTIQDYRGFNNTNDLSNSEKHILLRWYNVDTELMPNENVISAACSRDSVYLKSLMSTSIDKLKKIFTNKDYKYILFFNIFLLLLLYALNKSGKNLLINISVYFLIILSFLARDVDRVSLPLILGHSILLFNQIQVVKGRKRFLIMILYSILVGFILFKIGKVCLNRHVNKDIYMAKQTAVLDELTYISEKYNKILVPGIYFPGRLGIPYLQSGILFNEDGIFNANKFNILNSGWLARHPMNLGKFSYEKLITGEILFIISDNGFKWFDYEKSNNIFLSLYDMYYIKNSSCKHIIEKVDNTESLILLRMRLSCTSD